MRTLAFDDSRYALILLDQTRLPRDVVEVVCRSAADVVEAIAAMRVRGAPAIGVVAAYGMAIGAHDFRGDDADLAALERHMAGVAGELVSARPTAVNLRWAVERALATLRAAAYEDVPGARGALLDLAHRMAADDVAINRRMGSLGKDLVPRGANVLTHCNTGALATVDYGTALGVVRAAHEAGLQPHVYVGETRPFLQGARLTAWELQRLGVPMTLITDSMAGHFMAQGSVDVVLVGADRIAANGDVANKIGTYSLAVLARAHDIPLYVVAPTSTVDISLPSGAGIPIEERPAREVLEIAGERIAPEGTRAAHPAFDITPARLVSAIITERGVLRAPYEAALREAVRPLAHAA